MSRIIASKGAPLPAIFSLEARLQYEASLPPIDRDDSMVSAKTLTHGTLIEHDYASHHDAVLWNIGREVVRKAEQAEREYYAVQAEN